jgi:hypothetical protein
VYESVNPRKHPKALVWSSPSLSSIVGRTTSGDTDSDGKLEIIHSVNSSAGNSVLVIYENTGDNQFEEVLWEVVPSNQSNGEKVIADFDMDGRIEIAFCGGDGIVHVYESGGDNEWQQVWTTATGMINAYGAEGGADTDLNGRPELFVMGEMGGQSATFVFEALADNSFAAVDTIVTSGLGRWNALGDWDGDGVKEYAASVTEKTSIYAAQSPGNWQEVECFVGTDSLHGEIYMFDANQNDRDELFWAKGGQILPNRFSWVFEKPVTSSSGTYEQSLTARLQIHPNPVRGLAKMIVAPELQVFEVLVYDVTGRKIRSLRSDRAAGPLVLHASDLPSGTYVARIIDRERDIRGQGRFLVLR